MKQSGAKLLVEALKTRGVKHIFGLVGAQTMPVYDLLYDEPAIKCIFGRHEQCLSYACEGYAKVTGQPGVCLTEPGAGATNLLSGVAAAHCDSLPMIVITSQIPINMIGKNAIHECDLAGVFRPVVKEQFMVEQAAEMPAVIDQAFDCALSGRPGPVQVIMTTATLRQRAEPKPLRRREPQKEPAEFEIKLQEAARILNQAKEPIIYAGYGTVQAGAVSELHQLAEKLSAPVFTSLPARGVMSEDHPLCFGMLTFDGVGEIVSGADVCLAVGTRFSEWSTEGWRHKFPENLIQIDLDPEVIGLNYPVKLGLVADAKLVLQRLLNLVSPRSPGTLVGLAKQFKAEHALKLEKFMAQPPQFPLNPLWLLVTLRRCLPPDAIIVTDASGAQIWSCDQCFTVFQPRTLLQSETYQEIGSSFQMAIGAKVAAPERAVVCIAGDGGIMYQLGEIATALAHKMPILIVILNDGYYNMPRSYQEEFYESRYIGVELNNPDFAGLAKAFGAEGHRLQSPDQLVPLVKQGLSADHLFLIDVPIDYRILPERVKKRIEQRKRDPSLRLGR